MAIYKFLDGEELKEVEATSFKKACRQFRNSGPKQWYPAEWTTKKGIVIQDMVCLPRGRKKKLGK